MTKQTVEDPRRIRLYRNEAKFLLWVLENFRVTVEELVKLEDRIWSEWQSADFYFTRTRRVKYLMRKNKLWNLHNELALWEFRGQLGAARRLSERLRGWLNGGKPRARPLPTPSWLFEK